MIDPICRELCCLRGFIDCCPKSRLCLRRNICMYQVVWFKRDLRVCDNRVLSRAAEVGPVLPLYIVEPELWKQPDASGRQWHFISECLRRFEKTLARLGQPLVLRIGDAISVLEILQSAGLISSLWSHEETGNNFSYRRDQKVAAWCRSNGITWKELQTTALLGV